MTGETSCEDNCDKRRAGINHWIPTKKVTNEEKAYRTVRIHVQTAEETQLVKLLVKAAVLLVQKLKISSTSSYKHPAAGYMIDGLQLFTELP